MDRDEAYAAIRILDNKNTELAERLTETEKQLARADAQNRCLRAEKNEAVEKCEEARAVLAHTLDKYRELRDRVEKLAHRVEEMTGDMISSVHEL